MQEVEQKPGAEIAPDDMTHSADSVAPEADAVPEVGTIAVPEVDTTMFGDEDPFLDEGFLEGSDIVAEVVTDSVPGREAHDRLKAVIEAAIYITDEPLSTEQIATAVEQPLELVQSILASLVEEYAAPARGLAIRELAGGYKLSTKPEHHEDIRKFVKRLQAPLKLSLAALETLAVIAYKQPITGPEVLDIRGVQGAGVLKTLLDRRLIATAGRKNVLGKPMMYKTTRDFLVQFGLNSLAELPTLKEFEELGRLALGDDMETPGGDVARGTTRTAAGGASLAENGNFDFEAAEAESELADATSEAAQQVDGEESSVHAGGKSVTAESDLAEPQPDESGSTVKQN
jgi:segregation and condensation protein B